MPVFKAIIKILSNYSFCVDKIAKITYAKHVINNYYL